MKDYKKILEGVVNIVNTTEKSDIGFANICTYIGENCPELKESEDEKIRKALIRAINNICNGDEGLVTFNGFTKEQVLTWLEKQGDNTYSWKPTEEQLDALDYAYNSCPDTERGNYYEGVLETLIDDLQKLSEKQCEQKPDKVEQKFHKGDWVVWDNKICCHIDNIYQGKESLMYTITDTNNMTRSYSVKGFDNNAHLWTIQDAKDGDVLVAPPAKGSEHSEIIFIFKEIKDREYVKNAVEYYCRCMDNKFASNERGFMGLSDDYFTPATKEQRDTLEKAMADAGFIFDFDKKELKKIEETPEWSEEDEINYNYALAACVYYGEAKGYEDTETHQKANSWLKSLKDRCTWKPNDEQMETLDEVFGEYELTHLATLCTLYNDLKKLNGK